MASNRVDNTMICFVRATKQKKIFKILALPTPTHPTPFRLALPPPTFLDDPEPWTGAKLYFFIHRVDNIPKYILCHGFTLYLAIQLPSRSYASRADLSHFHRYMCPPFSPAPAVCLMQDTRRTPRLKKNNAFRHYRNHRRGSTRLSEDSFTYFVHTLRRACNTSPVPEPCSQEFFFILHS